jgi:glycine cleavage system H protein
MMTAQAKECKYSIGDEIPAHPCLREWACKGCPTQELISAILDEYQQDTGIAPGSEEVAAGDIGGFSWASNLFYHPSHFWLTVKRNGVRFGLDDIAQTVIGKVTEAILPPPPFPGSEKKFTFELVSGMRRLKLTAPFLGQLRRVNISLYLKPELINIDPYGWGWLAEFDLKSFRLKAENLMSSIKSREWFIGEFIELHRLYNSELGELSNDGGEINKRSFSSLSDDEWGRLVQRMILKNQSLLPATNSISSNRTF